MNTNSYTSVINEETMLLLVTITNELSRNISFLGYFLSVSAPTRIELINGSSKRLFFGVLLMLVGSSNCTRTKFMTNHNRDLCSHEPYKSYTFNLCKRQHVLNSHFY